MFHLPIPFHKLTHTLGVDPINWIIPTLLLALLAGCGGPLVGVTVVDERTALENQVLGALRVDLHKPGVKQVFLGQHVDGFGFSLFFLMPAVRNGMMSHLSHA